jgi:DNA-binding MarR family transcriptional regulator
VVDVPSSQALRFVGAVRELATAVDRYEETAARALGLARSDVRALNLLEAGPVAAGELGEHLRLTSGSVTGLIDRLEAAGYVTREPDQADRRRVLVRLEPAAYAAFARVYAPCGAAVRAVGDQLGADVVTAVAAALEATAAAVDAEESRLRDG